MQRWRRLLQFLNILITTPDPMLKHLLRKLFGNHKLNAASFLQQEINKRLLERLDFILLQPKTILVLENDIGAAADDLAKKYPEAQITRETMPTQQGVLSLPQHSFDLIYSNLSFYVFPEYLVLFNELQRLLTAQGLLFFSTLGPDTFKELNQWPPYQTQVNPQLIDLHDIGDKLMHAHFSDPVMEMETITLTYGDLKQLLSDIKSFHSLTSTELILNQDLSHHYETYRNSSLQLPVTFEIIYGHAWNKQSIHHEDKHEVSIPIKSILMHKNI